MKTDKNKTFYKLTYLEYSLTYWQNYSLDYAIGRTTLPVIGKIFVFDSLKNLMEFASNSGHSDIPTDYCVFEGKVTNPHKILRVLKNLSKNSIEEFWKNKKNKKSLFGIYFSIKSPKGTYVVDSFTPTKVTYLQDLIKTV